MLKLVTIGRQPWSYNDLAIELGISPSQAHSAVKRALSARLALVDAIRGGRARERTLAARELGKRLKAYG